MQIYLHICKKSSTFAGKFDKNEKNSSNYYGSDGVVRRGLPGQW